MPPRASHHERGMIRSCEDEHGRALGQAQQLGDGNEGTAEATRSVTVSVLTRDRPPRPTCSAKDQLARDTNASINASMLVSIRADSCAARDPGQEAPPDTTSSYKCMCSACRRTVSRKVFKPM
jgi:hypothetical protein